MTEDNGKSNLCEFLYEFLKQFPINKSEGCMPLGDFIRNLKGAEDAGIPEWEIWEKETKDEGVHQS